MNEGCCPSLKTLSISYWSVTQLHRSEARCVYNLLSSEASLNYFTFICAYSSHTFLDRSNLIFMPLTMLFMPPVFFFFLPHFMMYHWFRPVRIRHNVALLFKDWAFLFCSSWCSYFPSLLCLFNIIPQVLDSLKHIYNEGVTIEKPQVLSP